MAAVGQQRVRADADLALVESVQSVEQRSRVDLPAPLGPIRATVSPASIRRLTSSSTRRAAETLGQMADDDLQLVVHRPFPQRRSR